MGDVPPQYQAAFQQATAQYPNVPPGVLFGLIQQESRWNPNAYNARSGATGIAQFLPATAQGLGVNPRDPQASIVGAAKYLSQLIGQFGGNVRAGIAAYNAGPGNVQRYGLDGVLAPDFAHGETRDYLAAVERFAGAFGGSGTGGPPVAPGTSPGASGGNPVLGCLPGAAGGAAALLGALWWLGVCRWAM